MNNITFKVVKNITTFTVDSGLGNIRDRANEIYMANPDMNRRGFGKMIWDAQDSDLITYFSFRASGVIRFSTQTHPVDKTEDANKFIEEWIGKMEFFLTHNERKNN